MTNPKTAESRGTAGRPKPATAPTAKTGKEAATVSTEDSTAAGPAHNGQNPVLDQLVALTRSIGDLVQQNVGTGDQLTTAATDAAEQARVVFAYDFLGVVLGRRAPSVFQLTTVTVERRFGTLTFTGLGAAKAAKIRAADNTVRFLEGLRDGVAVTIDEGPKAISDNLRIDSIITFTALGGTPVAIGPCLGPAVGGDG